MKILLFSDSHGNIGNMVKAVSKHRDADMIIHLGDIVRDALKLKELYKNIKLEFVRGNNDWNQEYPNERILELEGRKILITHGHHYNVKYDYQRITLRGKTAGVNAVFFGHTHVAEEFFSDGMLVLNPGSISLPAHSANPSYCIVQINEERIISRFMGLG